MNTVDELIQLIYAELPNCPQVMQKQHLQRALIEFCKDSELLQETITRNVVADQATYYINSTYDASIHRLLSVKIDDRELDINDYELVNESELRLDNAHTEDVTDGLVIKMVLRPTLNNGDTESSLPSIFLDRYGHIIATKAKSSLMLIPRKPWSEPQTGAYYAEQYRIMLNESKINRGHQHKNGDLVIEAREFV